MLRLRRVRRWKLASAMACWRCLLDRESHPDFLLESRSHVLDDADDGPDDENGNKENQSLRAPSLLRLLRGAPKVPQYFFLEPGSRVIDDADDGADDENDN
jgi:hypothetical protein